MFTDSLIIILEIFSGVFVLVSLNSVLFILIFLSFMVFYEDMIPVFVNLMVNIEKLHYVKQ